MFRLQSQLDAEYEPYEYQPHPYTNSYNPNIDRFHDSHLNYQPLNTNYANKYGHQTMNCGCSTGNVPHRHSRSGINGHNDYFECTQSCQHDPRGTNYSDYCQSDLPYNMKMQNGYAATLGGWSRKSNPHSYRSSQLQCIDDICSGECKSFKPNNMDYKIRTHLKLTLGGSPTQHKSCCQQLNSTCTLNNELLQRYQPLNSDLMLSSGIYSSDLNYHPLRNKYIEPRRNWMNQSKYQPRNSRFSKNIRRGPILTELPYDEDNNERSSTFNLVRNYDN